MAENKYNSSNLLYQFDSETTDDIMRQLASLLKTRRLERGLSREALSMMSGVPVATITKFEQRATLSLKQYVALCNQLYQLTHERREEVKASAAKYAAKLMHADRECTNEHINNINDGLFSY